LKTFFKQLLSHTLLYSRPFHSNTSSSVLTCYISILVALFISTFTMCRFILYSSTNCPHSWIVLCDPCINQSTNDTNTFSNCPKLGYTRVRFNDDIPLYTRARGGGCPWCDHVGLYNQDYVRVVLECYGREGNPQEVHLVPVRVTGLDNPPKGPGTVDMETLKKVEDALWEEQQRQRDAKWLVYDDRTPRDSLRETTAIILNAEVNDSVAQRTSTSHELHRDEATSKLKKAFTMSHHSISPASPASGDEAASSASIISSLPESLKNDSASSRNATKALHDIRFKVKKLVALASDIKAKYKAEEERMRSMAPASQHQDQYRRGRQSPQRHARKCQPQRGSPRERMASRRQRASPERHQSGRSPLRRSTSARGRPRLRQQDPPSGYLLREAFPHVDRRNGSSPKRSSSRYDRRSQDWQANTEDHTTHERHAQDDTTQRGRRKDSIPQRIQAQQERNVRSSQMKPTHTTPREQHPRSGSMERGRPDASVSKRRDSHHERNRRTSTPIREPHEDAETGKKLSPLQDTTQARRSSLSRHVYHMHLVRASKSDPTFRYTRHRGTSCDRCSMSDMKLQEYYKRRAISTERQNRPARTPSPRGRKRSQSATFQATSRHASGIRDARSRPMPSGEDILERPGSRHVHFGDKLERGRSRIRPRSRTPSPHPRRSSMAPHARDTESYAYHAPQSYCSSSAQPQRPPTGLNIPSDDLCWVCLPSGQWLVLPEDTSKHAPLPSPVERWQWQWIPEWRRWQCLQPGVQPPSPPPREPDDPHISYLVAPKGEAHDSDLGWEPRYARRNKTQRMAQKVWSGDCGRSWVMWSLVPLSAST